MAKQLSAAFCRKGARRGGTSRLGSGTCRIYPARCGYPARIRADAGLDIGGTLIGMHLKRVAVPVRLRLNKIGEANILSARTRPKLIGGERAKYTEED